MSKTHLSLLLFTTAIAASASAHAQVCGATLYSSLALTADMVCPGGVDGIVIGDHNVRIDLNGYAITSPNSTATTGIRSSGFRGIKIVGPGKITGFDTSVMIFGGDYTEIRDIDAATVSTIGARIGIWLHNTTRSVIERSRVGVVELGSDPGYRAAANRIVGNDADSIHLYGCDTYKNVVAYNDIHPATQFTAISLDGGTSNQLVANRITTGTVFIGGSSHNLVADNIIDNTVRSWVYTGVAIRNYPSPCAAGALADSTGNLVRGNAIIGGHMGVMMREGSHYNQITGNKIYDQVAVGLQFFVGSDNNDARGNGYGNVPVEVVDMGQRNLWP